MQSVCSADTVYSGCVLGGSYAVSAGPDYVPATMEVHCGGAQAGSKFKVAIYDGTSLVTGCVTEEMTNVDGVVSGNVTSGTELSLGKDYGLVIIQDGYQYFYVAADVDSGNQKASNTYSGGFPSTLPAGSYQGNDGIEIHVKNSAGDVILGKVTFDSVSKESYGGEIISWYNTKRYQVVT